MPESGDIDSKDKDSQTRPAVELTRLGKEIIPVNLVRRNASYKVIGPPRISAYPRGDEVIYTDDYLSRIDSAYPLQECLGRKKGILGGNRQDFNDLVVDSPLQNSEGEEILRHILYNSARRDRWQPKVVDVSALGNVWTPENYLDEVAKIDPDKAFAVYDIDMSLDVDAGKFSTEFKKQEVRPHGPNSKIIHGGDIMIGISVAQKGGAVLLTIYENKVVVIPHQKLIEYFIRTNRGEPRDQRRSF